MSLPNALPAFTPEEYLRLERSTEERHESLDGLVYAMSAESLAHGQICVNILGELRTQLRGRDCQVLSPNMRVRAGSAGLSAYPDATVVCGEPEFQDEHRDVLLNPTVIFEVLSPSTERYDRGEKFLRYRTEVETLADYVLVAQERPRVKRLSRMSDGSWQHEVLEGLSAVLNLRSINCRVALADLYDRVAFPEP